MKKVSSVCACFICFFSSVNLTQEVQNQSQVYDSYSIDLSKYKCGDLFINSEYYGDKNFFNRILKHYSLDSVSSYASKSMITEILPGNYVIENACMMYVDKNLKYIIVDFEATNNAKVVDVGIIETYDNKIVFKGIINTSEMLTIKEIYFRKSKRGRFYFRITFDNYFSAGSYSVNLMQAAFLDKFL